MVRTDEWQVRLIQLLSVPGMILAYYLWLFHNGDVIAACRVTELFDCGQVSGPDSPYSAIGPIPVATIGFVGYAFIFLLVWLKDWLPLVDDYLPELMLGTVGIAFLFTAFLTGLELFVINALCQYCVWSAGIILVMLVLAISYVRSVGAAPDDG